MYGKTQNADFVNPMLPLQEQIPYPQHGTPPYGACPAVSYMPDYQLMQVLQNAQAENVCLKEQLRQKILKEEEFNHILQMQGNAYYISLGSGRVCASNGVRFSECGQNHL